MNHGLCTYKLGWRKRHQLRRPLRSRQYGKGRLGEGSVVGGKRREDFKKEASFQWGKSVESQANREQSDVNTH